jgi:membrane protease YdiL (CAAX protease family)
MLLCPLMISLSFVVLPAITLAKTPWTLHWSALLSLSVFNYSTLIGGPLGEEPGWRGFALPRLERMM